MNFIVYTSIREENLHNSLGLPEYSYYFVMKGFLPVLRDLGKVYLIDHPDREVDRIYEELSQKGENCLYVSFTPPNKAVVDLRCPTACVFAWEFERIPDEVWDNEPRNDWTYVLSKHGRAISLSTHTAQAVKKALGDHFKITAIPVPVWDHFASFRYRGQTSAAISRAQIRISGNIVDSRNYFITPETFELRNSIDYFKLESWSGEKRILDFSEDDEFSAYLGGFYKPEDWGAWTRIEKPWILLPFKLSGKVHLCITAHGYGHNINRKVVLSVGGVKKKIRLLNVPLRHHFQLKLKKADNLIQFSGLDLTPLKNARDPRSLGIGLQSIEIWGKPGEAVMTEGDKKKTFNKEVVLEGAVYTSVFSPQDGRKNWKDIVTAFCYAFQDVEDSTLVLKMSHRDLSSFMGKLHFLLQQMYPFKCRVVALHGYLDKSEYESLISVSKFYVNASRCEGLCLPLMEFMACRKPAIAPQHTAMVDYVDSSFAIIVDTSLEPCKYPHETRDIYRTRRYRIHWASLVDAFRRSYGILKDQPELYQTMCNSAASKIEAFSSMKTVKNQFMEFLEKNHFPQSTGKTGREHAERGHDRSIDAC